MGSKQTKVPSKVIDIDAKVVMFLIGAGVIDLRRCLVACRTKLLQAGVKAQNLPTDRLALARFASKLNDKGIDIVCRWLRDNCELSDVTGTHEAIALLSVEPAEGTEDRRGDKGLWKSVLAGFVAPVRSQEVDAFLRVGKKNAVKLPTVTTPKSDISSEKGTIGNCDDQECNDRLVALLLAGVDAVFDDEGTEFEASRKMLESDGSSMASLVVPILDRVKARADIRLGKASHLPSLTPTRLSDAVVNDPTAFQVLASVKRILPNGQAFMHVHGLWNDELYIPLDDGEGRLLFPESGSITAFAPTMLASGLRHGDWALWRVAHESPGMTTEFVAKEMIARVQSVISVPHSSSEPGKVRQWIQGTYVPPQGMNPVFQLSDGPIIRFQGDPSHFQNSSFDTPASKFNHHPTVWTGDRLLVFKRLPAPDNYLDCAPTELVIKRLLKHRSEIESLPLLTKAQVNDLAEYAGREGPERFDPASVEHALDEISRTILDREIIHQFLEQLCAVPAVADQLVAAKASIVAEFKAKVDQEQSEVHALRTQKAKLESELATVRKTIKEEGDSLAAELKRAFKRASDEGIKTLSEVVVFKALLGIQTAALQDTRVDPVQAGGAAAPVLAQAASPPVARTAQSPLPAREGSPWSAAGELTSILARQAAADGSSHTMLRTAVAAAATAGIVGLSGTRTREVCSGLSMTLAGGKRCVVSVSGDMFSISDLLSSPTGVDPRTGEVLTLGDYLKSCQQYGELAFVHLQGANRTPPETYLPELQRVAGLQKLPEELAWRDKAGAPHFLRFTSPVVFALDFVRGKSVFPVLPPVAWELPVIDTDIDWGDVEPVDVTVAVRRRFPTGSVWSSLGKLDQGLPAARLDGVPPSVRARAAAMASAAIAAGSTEEEAIAGAVMAYCQGRAPGISLVDAVGMSPAFAERFSRSLPSKGAGPLDHLFEMDNQR